MRVAVVSGLLTCSCSLLIAACGSDEGPTEPRTASVVWKFCGTPNTPLWVASQNGNGPWTYVAPGTDNTWSFNISAKGGVAYVVAGDPTSTPPSPTGYSLIIVYGTLAELRAHPGPGCSGPAALGTRTLTSTLDTALLLDAETHVSLGGTTTRVPASDRYATAFSLLNVREGALDLVASLRSINTDPDEGDHRYTRKLIIRRGVNTADNSMFDTLDFRSAEAITPNHHRLSIANPTGGFFTVRTVLQTATTSALLGLEQSVFLGRSVDSFPAVPDFARLPTDLHILTVTMSDTPGYRTVTTVLTSPAEQSITLGPQAATGSVTLTGTAPYVRMRAEFPHQAEYNQLWTLRAAQHATRTVNITVSAGYLGNAPLDAAIPDFSTVANWSDTWGMVTGKEILWTLTAKGWSGPGSLVEPVQVGVPVNGVLYGGTFTP